MAPARASFRVSRATASLYTSASKKSRGPSAIQKRVCASPSDRFRYESLEESAAAFAAFKKGVRHLQRQPYQKFRFPEGTPTCVRVAEACKFRGCDDTLLHPQLYVTSDGYKVVYCHVCEEDYSVTNYNKVKTRHASSDEHLAKVARLLQVDPNCLRNPYRCYVSSCMFTAGGEREDALLKHYKIFHLGLRQEDPLPDHVKASLEGYKRAMQAAVEDGHEFAGYPVPSTLTSPALDILPAFMSSPSHSLYSPGITRSSSVVSSSSSSSSSSSYITPTTPMDDFQHSWSLSPSSTPLGGCEPNLDAWFSEFEVGSSTTVFPPLESSPTSFLSEQTQPEIASSFDFSALSSPDTNSFEFSEVGNLDGTSCWDLLGFSDEQSSPSPTSSEFDFPQESGSSLDVDIGGELDMAWTGDLSCFVMSS